MKEIRMALGPLPLACTGEEIQVLVITLIMMFAFRWHHSFFCDSRELYQHYLIKPSQPPQEAGSDNRDYS